MNLSTMKIKHLLTILLAASLVACTDDSAIDPLDAAPNPPPAEPQPAIQYSYDVAVTNLTLGQPMSPITIIAHDDNFNLFDVGSAASLGLEQVGESGDNSVLIDEAVAAQAFATTSGTGIVIPSASETISFNITQVQAARVLLSMTTMLVNTNDAITAARNIDFGDLAVGDSMSFTTLSYDTGTEANTEAAGTIPGPADGGEGFNMARDDIADQVTLHAGVITSDDGLMTSVLSQNHRWDNPVLRVTITRTE